MALERRRDEVQLPSGPVKADLPNDLLDQVGQLVVERQQTADQALGRCAAISPHHVGAGLGCKGGVQQGCSIRRPAGRRN